VQRRLPQFRRGKSLRVIETSKPPDTSFAPEDLLEANDQTNPKSGIVYYDSAIKSLVSRIGPLPPDQRHPPHPPSLRQLRAGFDEAGPSRSAARAASEPGNDA
jgi:hypothetical protein